MRYPTREEIAKDWFLWIQYVDPGKDREYFDSLSVSERIEVQDKCWPLDTELQGKEASEL